MVEVWQSAGQTTREGRPEAALPPLGNRCLEAKPSYRFEIDTGIVVTPPMSPAVPVPTSMMVPMTAMPSAVSPPSAAASPVIPVTVTAMPPVVPTRLGGRGQPEEQAAGDYRRTTGQQNATARIQRIRRFGFWPVPAKHVTEKRDRSAEPGGQVLVHLVPPSCFLGGPLCAEDPHTRTDASTLTT
jgi:hypothetical protein